MAADWPSTSQHLDAVAQGSAADPGVVTTRIGTLVGAAEQIARHVEIRWPARMTRSGATVIEALEVDAQIIVLDLGAGGSRQHGVGGGALAALDEALAPRRQRIAVALAGPAWPTLPSARRA